MLAYPQVRVPMLFHTLRDFVCVVESVMSQALCRVPCRYRYRPLDVPFSGRFITICCQFVLSFEEGGSAEPQVWESSQFLVFNDRS
jgi:hypothetical protein